MSMSSLALQSFHETLGGRFTPVGGALVVEHYGDPEAEHAALRQSAAVLDLSCRSRLCVVGGDRERFLNGQVTNNVKALSVGEGCYAAVVNARGRMQSDANIYRLAEECLLDFEPGLSAGIARRLEQYVVADDVQIVDVAADYGLLSVQGPQAATVLRQAVLLEAPAPTTSRTAPSAELPTQPLHIRPVLHPGWGELYVAHHARTGTTGFDLFVPVAALRPAAESLVQAARDHGGRPAGWTALEIGRVEAGRPRFGADMDETTLPIEAGIEARAISYRKGCYIGQEIIARLHAHGRLAKSLCGLRLADAVAALPRTGDRLLWRDREVGHVTTAVTSPALRANLALGYVRREAQMSGEALRVQGLAGDDVAHVVALPFG